MLNSSSLQPTRHAKKIIAIFAVLLVVVIAVMVLPVPDIYGIDFPTFYHAGQLMANSRSPYEETGFHNPIWVAVLLVPLSLLPEEIAYRAFFVVSLGCYLYVFLRFSTGSLLALIGGLLSSMLWYAVFYGTLDFMVLLALLVPAELGIWLALSKPQMGVLLAVLLVWRVFKARGVKAAGALVILVSAAMAGSFLVGMKLTGVNMAANAALWPLGLLFGIPVAVKALTNRDEALALVASVFSTPYLSFGSWCAVLPAAMRKPVTLPLIAIGSWLAYVVVFRRML